MAYMYVLRAFDAPLRIVYSSNEQYTMTDSSYPGDIPYMLVDVQLICFAKILVCKKLDVFIMYKFTHFY
jgi:hypothetical protein